MTWPRTLRPWPGTMSLWTWWSVTRIQGMAIGATDVPVRDVPLTGENRLVHSPAKLAQALAGLLA